MHCLVPDRFLTSDRATTIPRPKSKMLMLRVPTLSTYHCSSIFGRILDKILFWIIIIRSLSPLSLSLILKESGLLPCICAMTLVSEGGNFVLKRSITVMCIVLSWVRRKRLTKSITMDFFVIIWETFNYIILLTKRVLRNIYRGCHSSKFHRMRFIHNTFAWKTALNRWYVSPITIWRRFWWGIG